MLPRHRAFRQSDWPMVKHLPAADVLALRRYARKKGLWGKGCSGRQAFHIPVQ